MGRDLVFVHQPTEPGQFQSTRPRGARLRPSSSTGWRSRFQSTRPRGARPFSTTRKPIFRDVSIHAPAWGATVGLRCPECDCTSFNPRARVGRDGLVALMLTLTVEFQSTRPRGARPLPCRARTCRAAGFNPRARVGRDPSFARAKSDSCRFQSTRPRGARHVTPQHAPVRRQFQSTRPRGARRITGVTMGAHRRFQSTRPRGARPSRTNRYRRFFEVSIHAPAWGATLVVTRERLARSVSIHAPAWGATKGVGLEGRGQPVSIHAPAWGATLPVLIAAVPTSCFNPRARVGRDAPLPGTPRQPLSFQSTRPRGARLSVRNRLYFRQDTTNISTTLTLLPEKAAPHPEKEVFFCFITL